MLLPLGTVPQSAQRESNPHVYPGQVARDRFIMDADGFRTSRRSRWWTALLPVTLTGWSL